MRSKGNNRTAIEQRWLETVAEFGRESRFLVDYFGVYCDQPTQFHIDHILGAQAKRKIDLVSVKIGEFAIIPLPIELHEKTSGNKFNLNNRAAFKENFGSRKSLFEEMISMMKSEGIEIPFDADVVEAIVYG